MPSKTLLQLGIALWIAAGVVFWLGIDALSAGGMRLDGVLGGMATKADVLAGALVVAGAVLVGAGSRNRL